MVGKRGVLLLFGSSRLGGVSDKRSASGTRELVSERDPTTVNEEGESMAQRRTIFPNPSKSQDKNSEVRIRRGF